MATAQVDKLDAKPSGLQAWERRLWDEGHSVIAGTDEAGRGPLAGPVVAAAFAVLARDDQEVLEVLAAVADSKVMTAQQREELFERLTDPALQGRVTWAIAETSVAEIDETNILQASLTAMSRSVQSLAEPRPDVVLVDGCNRPPDLLKRGEQWTRGPKDVADVAKNPRLTAFFGVRTPPPAAEAAPWRPKRVEAVIEGDGLVPSISAASILAKVHRDRLMDKLHQEFPVYDFASHKGYGTESHMEAIRLHGVCREHRKSFAPIREVLGLDVAPEQPAAVSISALLGANRGVSEETLTPQRSAQVRATSASGAPAGDAGAVDPTPAKPSRQRAKTAAAAKREPKAAKPAARPESKSTKAAATEESTLTVQAAKLEPKSTKPAATQESALTRPAVKQEPKSAKPAAKREPKSTKSAAKQEPKSTKPAAKHEPQSTKSAATQAKSGQPGNGQKSRSARPAGKQNSKSTDLAAKQEEKLVKPASKRESKSAKPAAKRAKTS